jgi:hypothetical protein
VIAGFLDGPEQLALWAAALAIDYLGPLVGGMRGWRISPAGLPLDAGVTPAALLGLTVVACLWWSYFDWVIFVGVPVV